MNNKKSNLFSRPQVAAKFWLCMFSFAKIFLTYAH